MNAGQTRGVKPDFKCKPYNCSTGAGSKCLEGGGESACVELQFVISAILPVEILNMAELHIEGSEICPVEIFTFVIFFDSKC